MEYFVLRHLERERRELQWSGKTLKQQVQRGWFRKIHTVYYASGQAGSEAAERKERWRLSSRGLEFEQNMTFGDSGLWGSTNAFNGVLGQENTTLKQQDFGSSTVEKIT